MYLNEFVKTLYFYKHPDGNLTKENLLATFVL